MKRQQLLLVSIALVVFAGLFFFGKTVSPQKKNVTPTQANQSHDGHDHSEVSIQDILAHAKDELKPNQKQFIAQLEEKASAEQDPQEKMHVFHQLARYWNDSATQPILKTYYLAEAAKLENSEKSLTFAAHQLIEYLLAGNDPSVQHWLGIQAKDLFERALQINPNNDSSKIGLGACYILGDVSDNPMTGISPVKEIAEKNPRNVYAQMVLGLGGMKSGQYDKAIERFNQIVKTDPANMEAMFHLAECYELKGDKANAVKWYEVIKSGVQDVNLKKVIDDRIKQLKAS